MKTLTKILLGVAVLSTLGLGGIVRSSYAQSQPPVVVTPQHSSTTQVPEASDGDGEANDATEASEAKQQPQNHQSEKQTDENEANEGPNDQDGGANEDAH
jgi:hypothetical protein